MQGGFEPDEFDFHVQPVSEKRRAGRPPLSLQLRRLHGSGSASLHALPWHLYWHFLCPAVLRNSKFTLACRDSLQPVDQHPRAGSDAGTTLKARVINCIMTGNETRRVRATEANHKKSNGNGR